MFCCTKGEVMRQYLELLDEILVAGVPVDDRTGTGTLSVFGRQLRFDLGQGFPLLTTKRLHFKSIVHELLWMISGSTNVKDLQANGVRIWDEWANEDGELGPVYGKQWRAWEYRWGQGEVDQLQVAINLLRRDPSSRRIIVNAWNVADLQWMALPPCHMMYQFYAADGRLSTHMYQRSADVFLGLPFNIASYALLTHMVGQVCNLPVGDLIISLGDAHLYRNHVKQARLQLARRPKPLPKITIAPAADIDAFTFGHFTLEGYEPHPHISAEVSV